MAWKSDISLSVLIIISMLHLSHNEDTTLVLYHNSLNDTTVERLGEGEKLMSKLNPDLLTLIGVNGFGGSPEGIVFQPFIKSYILLGTYNVMVVNWTARANPYPDNPALGYGIAVQNAKEDGEKLGLDIVKLVALGLLAEKIHLIGFSLGSYLVGCAGRTARGQGVTVNRATGLDPARLGFEPQTAYTPINQDSAKLVDCHHTDMGSCGMMFSTGHINFYYNAGNYYTITGSRVQPGCQPGYELCGNICSHNRAVYYWIEALTHPTNFLAGKANSYQEYANANGVFDVTNYVGYLCDPTLQGDFYLSTNPASLYGKQEAGLRP